MHQETFADVRVHLPDLLRRRHATRADRPDRFVAHSEIRLGHPRGNTRNDLVTAYRPPVARGPLRFHFADADDRKQPRAPRRAGLRGDERIELAIIPAALGMSGDDGACSGVLQHLRADVSGVVARDSRGAVLPADGDAAAGDPREATEVAGGQTRKLTSG